MPYLENDNEKIYYEMTGEGEEIIVFLNGVMMSTESWVFQVPVFSRKYRILLHDFRGQGRSSKPDYEYTFDMHADDIKSLLDELGIKKAHFVGTSYGAECGMVFAIKYPEYVKTLTVSAAVSESDFLLKEKIESWCIAARHAIKYGEKSDFMLLSAPYNFSSNFIEKHPGFFQEKAELVAQFPDEWFVAFIRLCECFKTLNITDHLSEITAPVLVIAAEHDVLKNVRYSAIMAHNFKNAESVIIMDAGHSLIYEKAAEFNSTLMGFIDKNSNYDS
ncbi:MAG: alpha/beta hydrolase [Gammaproteobacteria bacterium]|nr:MAG: alpha/beta hydrolase [Gammaproteobacteria bacterium]